MATSLALASPRQYDNVMSLCNGVACRSTKRTSTDPPAADWTTRSFVRMDCLEPAEGSAHFDDLTAHRSPPPLQGDLLPGQDCAPAGDDDAEE
jgi:hypothetical protein